MTEYFEGDVCETVKVRISQEDLEFLRIHGGIESNIRHSVKSRIAFLKALESGFLKDLSLSF